MRLVEAGEGHDGVRGNDDVEIVRIHGPSSAIVLILGLGLGLSLILRLGLKLEILVELGLILIGRTVMRLGLERRHGGER